MYFRSASFAAALLTACSPFALAGANAQGMNGGNVVAGTAQIVAGQPGQTTITQSTTKAVIEWQSFSVEEGGQLRFLQPDSKSITLNRVVGDAPSNINGSIEANGQVWLLNANGVMIGNSGRINAAGFLATTHSLSDQSFLSGRYDFIQNGVADGVIVNGGSIIANGGYAVLAGNQVANTGLIEANLGQIALGAGKGFTLDLVGDKLLSFAVTAPLDVMPTNGAAVSNSGTLRANGGRVLLTARAAADVVDNVINASGLVQAQSARMVNGEIILDGGAAGTVRVDGTLDVSGTHAGEVGGSAIVLGDTIILGDTARIDARGTSGGGSIFVGGGWQGASLYGRPSAVRVGAAAGAVLDASAIDIGDGGTVVLWTDVNNTASQTFASGSFYAKGGANGGNGGRIETSGHYLSTNGARGSAAAAHGKAGLWLFDPTEIVIAGEGIPTGSFQPDGDGQLWMPDEDISTILTSDIEALLNAGTNVYVTTTGAGDGSGDISIAGPITKSEGGDATLSIIAAGAIDLYDTISSTSGLSLILESISSNMNIGGSIDIDGDLTMQANSPFVWSPTNLQGGTFSNEGSISARNITLTAPDVQIYSSWSASESISIAPHSTLQSIYIGSNPEMEGIFMIGYQEFGNLSAPNVTIGRADGSNAVRFDAMVEGVLYDGPQTITVQSGGVGGTINFGNYYDVGEGNILRLIAGSDIFLDDGLTVDIAGRLDLISGQRVTNNAGESVFFMEGDGRWFISAATPDDVVFGGLISGQKARWNTPIDNAIGAANNASGNQFAFALSPILTITVLDYEKYAGTEMQFNEFSTAIEGLIDASAYEGAFEQDVLGEGIPIFSEGLGADAPEGTYAITLVTDLLPEGYTPAYEGATLTVNPPLGPPGQPDPPEGPNPPDGPDNPNQPETVVVIPLPDAITGGVRPGVPPIPPAPPAAPAPPSNVTATVAPPASSGGSAPSSIEDDEEQRNFLIEPQDPLNAMPNSPVSGQQPPTPRDIADGDDPFLLAAENNEPNSPPQNAERQGSSVENVAPGIGVDSSGMPLSPEIPGIEGRFSGTGDTSKW